MDPAAPPTSAVGVATKAPASYLRPKRAASLIILDRSGAEVTLLMGRRHASHVFLPDRYVFPGGRLERDDALMPVSSRLHESVAARLTQQAAALALCAIRETYEETGFCLGIADPSAAMRVVPAGWRDFAAHGILPDLAALHLVARALTPTGPVRRFDVHFFCAEATAIAHRRPDVVHAGSELVDLVWVTLAAAHALPIARVTHFVLDALERRLASNWSPEAPVPYFSWPRGRLRHVDF